MVRVIVAKQAVIDQALDADMTIPVVPVREQASTVEVSRAALEREALEITPAQAAAIHQGLRVLAGMCDGAQQRDGSGYSKMDARIGHDLAARADLTPRQAALGRKLVNRYRRQLQAEILCEVGIVA